MRRQGEPGVTITPRKHQHVSGGICRRPYVAVSRHLLYTAAVLAVSYEERDHSYFWEWTRYRLYVVLVRMSNVVACSIHKPEALGRTYKNAAPQNMDGSKFVASLVLSL